ncbi:DoxX family protein [Phytoactinopolyspora limicola]|uniref:DoxX family protein n=1 Tax=Phytoactinopolyspora limicola TaxID=2715536 RepID=UPI00140D7169|nr:DoxX family protein [Phytoactinopolyspora limicola]
MSPSRALNDAACLLLRLALAFVFVAHGWQKFYDWSIDGTIERFAEMNIPFPDVSAPSVAVLELVGGGLLGLGILTRVLAAVLAGTMIGALVLVHAENGPFVVANGFELVLVLAAGCIAVVLLGPGRVRADKLLIRWFRTEDDEMVQVTPRGRR